MNNFKGILKINRNNFSQIVSYTLGYNTANVKIVSCESDKMGELVLSYTSYGRFAPIRCNSTTCNQLFILFSGLYIYYIYRYQFSMGID